MSGHTQDEDTVLQFLNNYKIIVPNKMHAQFKKGSESCNELGSCTHCGNLLSPQLPHSPLASIKQYVSSNTSNV